MATKICSASTTEKLQNLINLFFYSTNWQVIEQDSEYKAYNPKLDRTTGSIKKEGKKFVFYGDF